MLVAAAMPSAARRTRGRSRPQVVLESSPRETFAGQGRRQPECRVSLDHNPQAQARKAPQLRGGFRHGAKNKISFYINYLTLAVLVVHSEPVSAVSSLFTREKTGNFSDFGISERNWHLNMTRKQGIGAEFPAR